VLKTCILPGLTYGYEVRRMDSTSGVNRLQTILHYYLRRMVGVEGGGSSRTVTRLHTMIGLTGYRTRDLIRIRRALYRLTEKA
jgi:hypothetical protein